MPRRRVGRGRLPGADADLSRELLGGPGIPLFPTWQLDHRRVR
jgi:hypothetical protein